MAKNKKNNNATVNAINTAESEYGLKLGDILTTEEKEKVENFVLPSPLEASADDPAALEAAAAETRRMADCIGGGTGKVMKKAASKMEARIEALEARVTKLEGRADATDGEVEAIKARLTALEVAAAKGVPSPLVMREAIEKAPKVDDALLQAFREKTARQLAEAQLAKSGDQLSLEELAAFQRLLTPTNHTAANEVSRMEDAAERMEKAMARTEKLRRKMEREARRSDDELESYAAHGAVSAGGAAAGFLVGGPIGALAGGLLAFGLGGLFD